MTSSPQGSEGCWLTVIPGMYAAAKSNSALCLAVKATAHAYARNLLATTECTIQACEYYDQSLRALQLDLASNTNVINEELLCAVLILGLYEV